MFVQVCVSRSIHRGRFVVVLEWWLRRDTANSVQIVLTFQLRLSPHRERKEKSAVPRLEEAMKELNTSLMLEPKCGYEYDDEFGLVKGVSIQQPCLSSLPPLIAMPDRVQDDERTQRSGQVEGKRALRCPQAARVESLWSRRNGIASSTRPPGESALTLSSPSQSRRRQP
eukprot:762577-Hanusia_phi.AAC.3